MAQHEWQDAAHCKNPGLRGLLGSLPFPRMRLEGFIRFGSCD